MTVIDSFLSGSLPRSDQGAGFTGVIAGITFLGALRAQFEYEMADTEVKARSLVSRAFLHLKRSIVADGAFRERWKQAFDQQDETRCEKLGAIHLLQHGIWAFKASAIGEQTDLVLGEPVDVNEVQGAAVALVLTEWKVVRKPNEAEAKATEARSQARRYSQSAMAGFELASRRYVVLVSAERLNLPASVAEAGVMYEHIGIPVAPETPSKEARRTS